MRETARIAQVFFDTVKDAPGLAKTEFITSYTLRDLQHLDRLPLLLVSPYMMKQSYGRQRRQGSQLWLNTFLVTRNRRGERDRGAALGIMELLDILDGLVLNKDLGLNIQPLVMYQREAVDIDGSVDQGLSVVRTVYATVVYEDLDFSKFTYRDGIGEIQTVEFTLAAALSETVTIQDTNDYGRALDGTMRTYARKPKKRCELQFILVPESLKVQLSAMKAAQNQITYHRHRDGEVTMTGYWTDDFDFFEERPGYWTGSIHLQEM